MGIPPPLRSAFPGSEIVGSAKIKFEETCPLFAYLSLSRLPSLRPGSALGEKGEKISVGEKKKSVSKVSQYFSYLIPFLPFFPQCRAWSQANVFPALSCLPYYLRACWNRLLLRGNKISERANRIQTMVAKKHSIIKLLVLS